MATRLMFDGSAICHILLPKGARRPKRSSMRQVSAKLRFTLGVDYHMIVPLGVSSPACFPNGEAGIMDSDLLDLEPLTTHNWAPCALAVIGLLAIFEKPEAVAC